MSKVRAIRRSPDWEAVSRKMPLLIRDFSEIINRESIDSALALPDFLIAEYLVSQLTALAELSCKAEVWANE